MILPLSYYGNSILRKKTQKIVDFDKELEILVKNMFETMIKHQGVGIAAPQVGLDLKIFIADLSEKPKLNDENVFINPILKPLGSEMDIANEGCLSIPNVYADVKRPIAIHIKAQNIRGEFFEMEVDDFFSRVLQHEYDHLQGVLFVDKILPLEKKRIEQELIEVRKNYA